MSGSAQVSANLGQPNPVEHLLQCAAGYIVSSALNVATELRIADHLIEGPKAIADLAAATGTHEESLYRILRALAMVGLFSEVSPRTFALTPSAELLRSDLPNSMLAVTQWMTDSLHLRSYAEMMHAAKTGETTVQKICGMPLFEYFAQNTAHSELFNEAMTSISSVSVPAVLAAYDFSGINTLVDVAGGHGAMLTAILQQYPTMQGILCDLPHVIPGGQERINDLGLSDRCQAVEVDFFQAVPSGGDAYIMKHIIHDWDDEKALMILKNCHQALSQKGGGKVLIVDAVLPSADQPHFAKMLDLEMLVLASGRERTETQFQELLERAGFRLNRIVPTEAPVSVIEGVMG